MTSTGPLVAADYPGWHVWRSDAGRWWATRTGPDAQWSRNAAGLPMTLDAENEFGIRAALAAAEEIQAAR